MGLGVDEPEERTVTWSALPWLAGVAFWLGLAGVVVSGCVRFLVEIVRAKP